MTGGSSQEVSSPMCGTCGIKPTEAYLDLGGYEQLGNWDEPPSIGFLWQYRNYTGEASFCARDLEPRSISSKILNDDPPKKKTLQVQCGDPSNFYCFLNPINYIIIVICVSKTHSDCFMMLTNLANSLTGASCSAYTFTRKSQTLRRAQASMEKI